jgi:toxin YoeB
MSGNSGDRPARDAVFATAFLEDLRFWAATDRKVALRLLDLVEAVMRDPFAGVGAPELLRHVGPNTWSRRITSGDRLVYRVTGDRVEFVQARYHYGEHSKATAWARPHPLRSDHDAA